MNRRLSILAIAALMPLVLAACGGDATSSAPATTTGGHGVAVALNDYSIVPDTSSLPAGETTFSVANAGATEHEMVVIRSDVAIKDIPVDAHEANEEAPGMTPIGEVEDVQPGESTDLTLTLEPGRYLLLCNIKGHFDRGMVTEVEVS
jgi:uncharacterized cupredoxin-like copper-binding protein